MIIRRDDEAAEGITFVESEAWTEPSAVADGPEMAEWPAPGGMMLQALSISAAAKTAAAPPATAGGSVALHRMIGIGE